MEIVWGVGRGYRVQLIYIQGLKKDKRSQRKTELVKQKEKRGKDKGNREKGKNAKYKKNGL